MNRIWLAIEKESIIDQDITSHHSRPSKIMQYLKALALSHVTCFVGGGKLSSNVQRIL